MGNDNDTRGRVVGSNSLLGEDNKYKGCPHCGSVACLNGGGPGYGYGWVFHPRCDKARNETPNAQVKGDGTRSGPVGP